MTKKSVPVRLALAGVGLAIAALSPFTSAQDAPVCGCADCADHVVPHEVDPQVDARVRRLVGATTFWALPEDHRDIIAAKLIERGEEIPSLQDRSGETQPELNGRDVPLTTKQFLRAWETVGAWDFCTKEQYASFRPVHQRMILTLCRQLAEGHLFHVQPCFTPGTDPTLVNTVSDIISFGRLNNPNPRFEQIGRWQATAMDPGSTGQQGEPTIVTYSFPPDGTFIASGIGEGDGTNNLNAWLDGIYGNRQTWRNIYDDIFARWGELSGMTYVLEPNDDGADILFDENTPDGIDPNPGVVGVRGDLRMTAKALDGNSGTLAYNFFPQFGDMVLDSADNFFNTTTNNSIGLRNILWHEHGHGMGQLHTCPIQENKLMEPFISTAFEGPQFDDILNAQRHYGDNLEPNDTAGSATDIGLLTVPDSFAREEVSLDDDQDVDYYRFTLASPGEVTAMVTPLTAAYDAGPQTFFCDEAAPYNPLVFLNPAIELLDSSGTTVIASSSAAPAGSAESVVVTLNAGDYLVRLTASNPAGDQIIQYKLDIDTADPPFLPVSITVAGGLPTELMPGDTTDLTITIDEGDDTLVGVPSVNYRREGEGSFTSIASTAAGMNTFTAQLPAFLCGEDPEITVTADGATNGTTTLPTGAPQKITVSSGNQVTIDDAETDIGWTVSGNAVEGIWLRAVPQNNDRDDPPADFDGSGQAWLTGQFPGDPNSDVDGGSTILTGPAFDYSSGGTISFAYWMNDTVNTIGPEDGFFVEYSTDGTTWTQIRSYSTSSVWQTDVIDVDSEIGTPSSLQIRFIATDDDPGNVLECAVDALEFNRKFCEDPMMMDTLCDADLNNTFTVDVVDFTIFSMAFNTSVGDPDYNPDADLNNSGAVDIVDFTAFAGEFGFGPAECEP